MSRIASVLAFAALAIPRFDAWACSFAPGFEVAQDSFTNVSVIDERLRPPEVQLGFLQRGFDDGQGGSCSDAGILRVELLDAKADSNDSFLFEITDGSLPESLIPDVALKPVEMSEGKHGFFFVWLDLPWGQSSVEPIEATLAVHRVSEYGAMSVPRYLRISHPGGNVALQYNVARGA